MGRTQQFINAFGEEVMIANAEMALSVACEKCNSTVADYTVAPYFLDGEHRGRHEWIIEFRNAPENLDAFRMELDNALRELNSDYDAKRSHNLALEPLRIYNAPHGAFEKWLASKGKLGGQNKVPRLSNSRKYLDEIMTFL